MQTIAITNVESYFGYVLAYALLQFLQENPQLKNEQEIRLLTRDRSGLEPLERLGGKVVQLRDYSNEQQIRDALREAQAVLVVPEQTSQMAEEGRNLIRAARQANVEYLALFSYIGSDRSQEDILKEYYNLENQAQQAFEQKSTVIRLPLFSQLFYYLVPSIEDRNVLGLPVQADQRWGSIDIREAAEAVVRLSQNSRKQSRPLGPFTGQRTTLQFTPRQNKNVQEILGPIAHALQRSQNIQYQQISEQDFVQYLDRIREDNRYRNRPQNDQQSFPLGRYLTNQNNRGIAAYLKLASQGQANVVSDDLRDALHRDPKDLSAYIETNADEFRRFK